MTNTATARGVYDIVRQRDWPEKCLSETLSIFQKAVAEQDFDVVTPVVGEAISLIHEVRPAAEIVRDMADDATRILAGRRHSAQYRGDQADVRSNRLSH